MKKSAVGLSVACAIAVLSAASASAQLVVYDDAVQNTFLNYSYNNGAPGASDFNNTAFFKTGTKSIQLIGFNYNAASFFHSGGQLTTAAYPTLHFWINGGAGSGQQINAIVYVDGPAPVYHQASLDPYINGGSIAANTWREVTIDL